MPTCTKRRYFTKAIAKQSIKRINKLRLSAKVLTDAYYCSECGYFHITSMAKAQSRKISRKKRN